MTFSIRQVFARVFAYIFFSLAALEVVFSFITAMSDYMHGENITQSIIKVINANVIAIAVFELAMVIHKEYGNDDEHSVIVMLRRTLPRFIGTVCVALALEGLIMVIKYSQIDLAGNLYYPVAIVASAAGLLLSLGVFLKHAPNDSQEH